MNSPLLMEESYVVASKTEYVVEAAQLKKSYPAPGGELEVLRGIDLKLRRGEFVAVMGLSGVGKSTLLNIIGLLDHATSGQLLFHIDGRAVDAVQLTHSERAQLCNRSIGFVFQFFHLLPDLNVLENVLLPSMIHRTRREYRAARPALEARARELLERMRIIDRAYHRPNALSGGERQRVAIARALMNSPSLVLCDEPTGNLDKKTSEVIHDLFKQLNRELGTSILVVTHDPNLAMRADRTLQMVDGQFI
ncbi:MAG: ABC transporter ATP-binding protein [Planctomycetota bacterium]